MSDGINRVILFGNLGAAPDLRMSQAGLGILHLRLATTESWFDKASTSRQERTEWHDVTVFGPRAEALARILQKGDSVLVEGGLRTSSYEKDGVKRYRTEVLAREVCLGGRRRGSNPPVEAEVLAQLDELPTEELHPSARARRSARARGEALA
jgi:single-strand DNA-binding protein